MNGTLAVRVLRNEMNYSAHPSIANRHVDAHMAGVVSSLSDSDDNTLCIK